MLNKQSPNLYTFRLLSHNCRQVKTSKYNNLPIMFLDSGDIMGEIRKIKDVK